MPSFHIVQGEMPITVHLAIVIPTRNRPQHLMRLLDSIVKGNSMPEQVIVISSGEDVSAGLRRYENLLEITHLHIKEKGQIRQKIAGVGLLACNIDWVFFSDDDLLFQLNTINAMRLSIKNTQKFAPVGIGTHIVNEQSSTSPKKVRHISRFFSLTSNKFGGVARSGLNSSYFESNELCKTEWLNGASLWQAHFAKSYKIPFLEARYSIYEDLIFSYPIGKSNCLLFDPSIKLSFQSELPNDVSSRQIFASKCYWRLYFVVTNPEMSLGRFFWTQIGISLQYLDVAYRVKSNVFAEAFFVIKLFGDAVILSFSQANPVEILQKRLKDKKF
jgi:hypothetical protein